LRWARLKIILLIMRCGRSGLCFRRVERFENASPCFGGYVVLGVNRIKHFHDPSEEPRAPTRWVNAFEIVVLQKASHVCLPAWQAPFVNQALLWLQAACQLFAVFHLLSALLLPSIQIESRPAGLVMAVTDF
jgi:hypothetical protein